MSLKAMQFSGGSNSGLATLQRPRGVDNAGLDRDLSPAAELERGRLTAAAASVEPSSRCGTHRSGRGRRNPRPQGWSVVEAQSQRPRRTRTDRADRPRPRRVPPRCPGSRRRARPRKSDFAPAGHRRGAARRRAFRGRYGDVGLFDTRYFSARALEAITLSLTPRKAQLARHQDFYQNGI
jgi:hypothetical protein